MQVQDCTGGWLDLKYKVCVGLKVVGQARLGQVNGDFSQFAAFQHAVAVVGAVIAGPGPGSGAVSGFRSGIAGAAVPLTVPGLTAAAEVVTAPAGVLGLLAEVLVVDDLPAARAAEPHLATLDRPATVITKDGTVVGKPGRGRLLKRQPRARNPRM